MPAIYIYSMFCLSGNPSYRTTEKMNSTLDSSEFISARYVAKATRLPVASLLAQADKEGLLFIDAQQSPVISVGFMERFAQATRPPVDHRAIQPLNPRERQATVSRTAIICMMIKNRDTSTADMIYLDHPREERLQKMLQLGKFRVRVGQSYDRYLLSDFEYKNSWASPAEKSWREALRWMQALKDTDPDALLRVLGRDEDECTYSVESEATREAAALERQVSKEQKEINAIMKRARFRNLEAVTGIRYARHERTAKPTARFTWQHGKVMMPPPDDRLHYYKSLPSGLFNLLMGKAQQWVDLLSEDRTGYHRVNTNCSEHQFREEIKDLEAEMYANQFAWEHGLLKPLMPAGFRFLF